MRSLAQIEDDANEAAQAVAVWRYAWTLYREVAHGATYEAACIAAYDAMQWEYQAEYKSVYKEMMGCDG